MNVSSSLMEIGANPVTRDGRKTHAVTYDSNCLERSRLVRHADQWPRPHGVFCVGR